MIHQLSIKLTVNFKRIENRELQESLKIIQNPTDSVTEFEIEDFLSFFFPELFS